MSQGLDLKANPTIEQRTKKKKTNKTNKTNPLFIRKQLIKETPLTTRIQK